jgi:anti-sigma factor RsiW
MDPTDFDDETLMAYADGALDEGLAQRIAAAAAGDPALARRIAVFGQTGALLGAVGAARPLPPLSADLDARIAATLAAARDAAPPQAATVLPFRPAARPAWRPLALAASVALLVGAVGGVVAGLSLRPAEAPGGLGVALLEEPGIDAALGRLAAGERGAAGAGEVAIIASFLTADGAFCREFEYDAPDGATLVSVACRADGGWQTQLAVVTGSTGAGGYAPASSLETLDAYLTAIGAGAPMSAAEEAAQLSALD